MDFVTRNSKLVGIALGSLVLLVGALGVYGWLFLAVQDNVRSITLASEETQLLTTQNEHTQTVRRVVRDTKTQRATLQDFFVTQEGLVPLLEEVEQIASYTGAELSVQSVDAGKAIDKDALLTPLTLQLKAIGSFAQVMHVLALLETFPTVSFIEKMRLAQHSTDDQWEGTYEVTLIQIEVPQ